MTRPIIAALVLVPWMTFAAVPGDRQQPEAAPLVTFGPGQHQVGAEGIEPGRYFVRPASGCYWERRSSAAATDAKATAFGFIGFDAAQWIVDVNPGDVFHANAACGVWSNQASEVPAGIPPGTWLVGRQVAPGIYSSPVAAGCYWERLADFTGAASAVIARGLSSKSGTEYVTIFANDAGFRSDEACGTWRSTTPRPPTLRIVE